DPTLLGRHVGVDILAARTAPGGGGVALGLPAATVGGGPRNRLAEVVVRPVRAGRRQVGQVVEDPVVLLVPAAVAAEDLGAVDVGRAAHHRRGVHAARG